MLINMNNFDEKEQSKTLFYEKHEIGDKKAKMTWKAKKLIRKSLIQRKVYQKV